MLMLITWTPELGTYRVIVPGRPDRLITPADLETPRYAPCRPAFDQARAAVESGAAVMGIHIDLTPPPK